MKTRALLFGLLLFSSVASAQMSQLARIPPIMTPTHPHAQQDSTSDLKTLSGVSAQVRALGRECQNKENASRRALGKADPRHKAAVPGIHSEYWSKAAPLITQADALRKKIVKAKSSPIFGPDDVFERPNERGCDALVGVANAIYYFVKKNSEDAP